MSATQRPIACVQVGHDERGLRDAAHRLAVTELAAIDLSRAGSGAGVLAHWLANRRDKVNRAC